ncbi:MAG: hypothetical protein PHF29_02510 [Candidatus Riflebacteria bacterium]|nr:hypothetical protein [Candidatus Riflebacteria bacterium]
MTTDYNSLEIITADTSFEAKLNAEEKYGKDGFSIIDGKTIYKSKLLGLIKKEMYELTIKIENNNTKAAKKFTQINVEMPPVQIKRETAPEVPIPDFITEDGLPELRVPEQPITYSPNQGARKMRSVNGIRSIQEGVKPPHSQKIDQCADDSDFTARVMLEKLVEHKNKTKLDPMIFSSKNSPVSPTKENKTNPKNSEYNSPNVLSIQLLRQMEGMLNTMREEIKQLNSQSQGLIYDNYKLPKGLNEMKRNLTEVETPNDVIQKIIEGVSESLTPEAQNNPLQTAKAYENWCIDKLKFSDELDFDNSKGPKVIVLIGPTGVGKTTTIAKLAAIYSLSKKQKKSVAFFTLDTYRIGAPEQLEHYAQHLDINMEIIYSATDIDDKLKEHQDKDLIIVDTAGRCQKETTELEKLSDILERLPNASKYLVLSATAKYIDMLETLEKFGLVGYDNLIFTKLDETNSIGPLLAIMLQKNTPLAFVTDGQQVPTNINKADFEYFYNNFLSSTMMFR